MLCFNRKATIFQPKHQKKAPQVNSSTQKLINPSTQKHKNSSAQNLKSYINLYKTPSCPHTILEKNKALKYAISPIFSIAALCFLFIFKNRNCILHHFTFLVDAQHVKISLAKTSYLGRKKHV